MDPAAFSGSQAPAWEPTSTKLRFVKQTRGKQSFPELRSQARAWERAKCRTARRRESVLVNQPQFIRDYDGSNRRARFRATAPS